MNEKRKTERRKENIMIYLKIEEMAEFLRSRNFTSDKLVMIAYDLVKIYESTKLQEECDFCKGSGVQLYNFWGEYVDKDDGEGTEVREEPCPKCQGEE